MNHIFKASKLFSTLRNRDWSQHEPNTISEGHNDDVPGKDFRRGKHPKSIGITSDYDWDKNPFVYKWNSLGLRGPEPNKDADRKILAIGNSLTLGSGVPVEESFIYKTAKNLNADYINLSDNFVLTDIIEPAKDIIKWYKPNVIYLNETRFIDSASFICWHTLKDGTDAKGEVFDLLIDGMCKTVSLFEDMLRYYAPNSNVLWDITATENNKVGRKSVLGDQFHSPEVLNTLTFPMYKFLNTDILLDLGRDGKHPGIKGHTWMSERLTKIIGGLI